VTPAPLRKLLVASSLGALVLGLGGRVLMRIIAVASGRDGGFSLQGSLGVLAAGVLYGALGGVLLAFLDRARVRHGRPPIVAAALFVAIGLTSDAARGAASRMAVPGRWVALGLFAALLLLYSTLLVRLTRNSASVPANGPATRVNTSQEQRS
jgi:hypothetical protein